MRPEVKFCGLTRTEDVDCALELGATHLGFVFADSPRRTTPDRVAVMTADLPAGVKRVGVFVHATMAGMTDAIRIARLDVVQLHDRGLLGHVGALRELGASPWAVVHVVDGRLPADVEEVARTVDAIVLDTRVGKRSGGTGVAFDWPSVAGALHAVFPLPRIVVAGGLRPDNVAHAIRLLDPDVVDVSSGVEAQPGVKDHRRMRAFMLSVRGAGVS